MHLHEITRILDIIIEHYLAKNISNEERGEIKNAYDTLTQGYYLK